MSPLYLLPLLAAFAAAGHFTNEWAVKISGDEAEAERVAKELNCIVVGEGVSLKFKFRLVKNQAVELENYTSKSCFWLSYSRCLPTLSQESAAQQPQNDQTCVIFQCLIMAL